MPQLINIGQEQLRINTSKVFLVLILGIISSCSVLDTSSGWVKTDDDILLWLSNCDTAQIYAWDGDIFDNVANGKGSVSMPNSEDSTITQQVNAFFGAIDNNEVISLDDGSKYVGNIIDDMMEGSKMPNCITKVIGKKELSMVKVHFIRMMEKYAVVSGSMAN